MLPRPRLLRLELLPVLTAEDGAAAAAGLAALLASVVSWFTPFFVRSSFLLALASGDF